MPSSRKPPSSSYQTRASRQTRSGAQGDAPPQATAPLPPMSETDRLGDILRRVREHRDEDLGEISEYLRIRPDYLVALENSRYDQLPADAYVIGFLRTYAAYLGLDGRGAIDQYRREMAGRRRKPQLSMPQPIPEGRAPTFVILLAAAFAFMILYGIWYGLSTPDEALVTQPLPISEAAAPDENESTAILLAAPSAPEAQPVPELQPAAAAPAASKIPAPAVGKTPNTTDPTPRAPVPAAPDAPAQPLAPTPAPEQKTAPTPEATTKPATPTPAPAPEPPQTEARSFGTQDSKSRVTIRVDKDSWVLVTDSRGVTVFERTLKAGESYNVPAAPEGLALTTGNVAGVLLTIDGKEMPRLPATGKVARGVPLDPDKLRSRLTAPLPPQPAAAAKDQPKDQASESE